MAKEKISWEETDKLIRKLGQEIKDSGFVPTIIAPIPRGGWCVAAVLAQYFGLKRTLGISHERMDGKTKANFSETNLAGENVLLIEDAIETGQTLQAIKGQLVEMGANVKTVCIFVSSESQQEEMPDFHLGVRELPDFVWEL